MKAHPVRPLLASILLSSSLGCTALLDLPDPVDSFKWCLDADPARGRSSENLSVDDIQTPAGNWTRGCKCYCPADNAIMVDGEAGLLAAGSANEAFYLGQVQTLRLEAQTACTKRVLELQEFGGTGPLLHLILELAERAPRAKGARTVGEFPHLPSSGIPLF